MNRLPKQPEALVRPAHKPFTNKREPLRFTNARSLSHAHMPSQTFVNTSSLPHKNLHYTLNTFATMVSRAHPEVDATITVCSRTLVGEQSAALQVANRQTFNLKHPKSRETIADWASELELDILIGFNIDPKRYKVHFHALAPSHRACPTLEEVRVFHHIDLEGMNPPVINDAFEVHFELRSKVKPPTVDELRQWQQRWAETIADPEPKPPKTLFALCQTHHEGKLAKSLEIGSLMHPREGDVSTTLRHSLDLMTTLDLTKLRLGQALGLDLSKDEVKYHLKSEACGDSHDIEDLQNAEIGSTDVVRLHLSSQALRPPPNYGGAPKSDTESAETDMD